MKLDDYLIKEEELEKLEDTDHLLKAFQGGIPLQQLFGFSDEALLKFYDTARMFIEEKRFEEAINSFVFLTALNPYLAELWQGLGLSYQLNQEHDNALYAYSVAFTLEERKIFPYVMAAQCCMEVKDYDQAHSILDMAEQCADANPEDEECRQLKQDAQAAKQYVLVQEQGGKR